MIIIIVIMIIIMIIINNYDIHLNNKQNQRKLWKQEMSHLVEKLINSFDLSEEKELPATDKKVPLNWVQV